jgi:hypothetical protein
MSKPAEAARERRQQGHTVHIVHPGRFKSHVGGYSGFSVPEWADMIEEIEAEGWRFHQMTPTAHGDMMVFRRETETP